MNELITAQELSKIGLSQQELLNKFNAQLIKDFERCALQNYLVPITSFDYAQVHKHVVDAIKEILRKAPGQYQQLLYSIDVLENQVAESNDEGVLSDLIIKRILQKVILKLIYSKK